LESTQSLSKNMDSQRDEHRVHFVVYHLIWCPKRRKSVLVGDIKTRCQQVIEWNLGMITSRVNPRNTSRECARCHSLIVRYAQGQPIASYTPGAPLVLCEACAMRGN